VASGDSVSVWAGKTRDEGDVWAVVSKTEVTKIPRAKTKAAIPKNKCFTLIFLKVKFLIFLSHPLSWPAKTILQYEKGKMQTRYFEPQGKQKKNYFWLTWMNFSKLRSKVFSTSVGKQQAGSSFRLR
jgi:hypothetical protein